MIRITKGVRAAIVRPPEPPVLPLLMFLIQSYIVLILMFSYSFFLIGGLLGGGRGDRPYGGNGVEGYNRHYRTATKRYKRCYKC